MAAQRMTVAVVLAWAALLALSGYAIVRELRISGDLRLFMPAPHTPTERLILEEVSEGPASRLLLIALTGASQDALAESSQRLASALRARSEFRFVENGSYRLDLVPQRLLPYRYLLSPTLDHARLDESYLRAELTERERDLASPAAALLEPWIPRDPTLEILKLLESWQPPHEPQLIGDVWFDGAGTTALLVAQSAAPAFDPLAQRRTLAALRSAFDQSRATSQVRLTVSGPGAFSVLMQGRSESDAHLAAVLDSAGMVLLVLLAYRRLRYLLLGVLPLASAGLVGLASVAALFGTVHGITLAFGFTLIGVALDYPIYLFSNHPPQRSPLETARRTWATLGVAVLALCIAYLAFLASGVTGLAQLACFNISGIATAGLTTRLALPRLMGESTRDYGDTALPRALGRLLARVPRVPWLGPALAVVAAGVLLAVPGPLWDNDLGHLTPVPPALLAQYAALQSELGAPDVRYLLAVQGDSSDAVLAREEALQGGLAALAARGAIRGFDDAARYLPSAATQQRRRAALPASAPLAAAVQAAARGLAFRPGLFAPFLADVARARELAPLTAKDLAGTPLEIPVRSLLLDRAGRWTGLVTFNDVRDPAALGAFARAAGPGASLLDLKEASEALIAHQRTRILWCLGGAALLLAVVIRLALGSARRAARVIAPMALTTLATLAILHAAGIALNLFHLIALILAAGLGLDYGLFFERGATDALTQRRTIHAVIVCAAAACVVFTVLASSALPVLRSIGLTVVIGVLGNFILALLLTRPAEARA